MLEQLGLRALLDTEKHRRAHSVFSAWGGGLVERSAIVDPSGAGWVLDRCAFEGDLQRAAREGAECRDGVLSQATTSGPLWHLRLADGSDVSASFVIDATGRVARLGRRLTAYRRIDRLLAATSTLGQQDSRVDPTPATLIEAVADGWWYASLLRSGRLSIAYFSDPDLVPYGLSSDLASWRGLAMRSIHLSRWLADADFAVTAPPRLVTAGTTCLMSAAGVTESGAGWAAAGDAATAFDPLSSQGLTIALWTGMKAGLAAAEWLAGNHAPLTHYATLVRKNFEAYLRQRQTYYSAENRFRDRDFWSRRNGA